MTAPKLECTSEKGCVYGSSDTWAKSRGFVVASVSLALTGTHACCTPGHWADAVAPTPISSMQFDGVQDYRYRDYRSIKHPPLSSI